MRKEMSLYLHIPFCQSKCTYCAFVSEVAGPIKMQRYVDNLIKEIRLRGKEYNPSYEISTIYIGGGTPSVLTIEQIKNILHEVYSNFTVQNSAEITIEINPNSLTEEKAQEYLSCGINRFSIGLQCAQTRLLKQLGRIHTFSQFEEAVKILRNVGANNISADVMIGIPTQKIEDVKETINKLLLMGIPHISSYILSVEMGTKLAEQVKLGTFTIPDDKTVIKMYNTVNELLKRAGYIRYEVSNFALPGFKSKHNGVYWARKEYLGLGVAAHSYLNNTRFSNTEDISVYFKYLDENKIPLETYDELTVEDNKEEMIMLSLRLKEGLDTDLYEKTFGESILAKKKDTIKDLITNGFLLLDETNHLRATDSGFMVLDKMISMLV